MTHRSKTFRTVSGGQIRIEIARPSGRPPSVFLTVRELSDGPDKELELSGDDVRAIAVFLGEDAAAEWGRW